MAETYTELRLPFKPVQEIDINSEDVPKQYMYNKEAATAINVNSYSADIPIIDMSLLSSSSDVGTEEIRKLASAPSSWVCFQAVNHGIPGTTLDNLQDIIEGFFRLPVQEKQRCSRPINDVEGFWNDPVIYEHQVLDWSDRLYLRILPDDQRRLDLWPGNPPEFRETVNDYGIHIKAILEIILKAMARSLDLEENCFLKQYGKRGFMLARFNLYPPCPTPDSVLGLKPHADGSAITVVLQDKEVEALQFFKEDQWFKAPIVPGALLINLGDQAEIMSNGIFKSPVHRVLTNPESKRISLAVFCSPDPENDIQPVEELIRREGKRRYKGVKDYLNNYFQHYQEGKRHIDAVRL